MKAHEFDVTDSGEEKSEDMLSDILDHKIKISISKTGDLSQQEYATIFSQLDDDLSDGALEHIRRNYGLFLSCSLRGMNGIIQNLENRGLFSKKNYMKFMSFLHENGYIGLTYGDHVNVFPSAGLNPSQVGSNPKFIVKIPLSGEMTQEQYADILNTLDTGLSDDALEKLRVFNGLSFSQAGRGRHGVLQSLHNRGKFNITNKSALDVVDWLEIRGYIEILYLDSPIKDASKLAESNHLIGSHSLDIKNNKLTYTNDEPTCGNNSVKSSVEVPKGNKEALGECISIFTDELPDDILWRLQSYLRCPKGHSLRGSHGKMDSFLHIYFLENPGNVNKITEIVKWLKVNGYKDANCLKKFEKQCQLVT